ncbi:MAG: T9SS type A sorting domain-containing protein [Bacteroidales bacterium]|nr:T9SS type A sorting domain-containing protein [Bacteroidales bacterium]
MKSIKIIVATIVMSLFVSTGLYSQEIKVLIESDFTGSYPGTISNWNNTSTLDNSIEFTQGWTCADGVFGELINNAFGFYVNGGSYNRTTLAQAITNNQYLSIKFKSTGDLLNLNRAEVLLGVNRIGYHSPKKYAVFTDKSPFIEGNELFVLSVDNSGTVTEVKGNFPGEGFENVTDEMQMRVYVYDAFYSRHASSIESFKLSTGDLEAPSAPLNLTAVAPNSYSVFLNWEESTDNVEVVKYNIYENDVLLSSTTQNSFSAGVYIANTTVMFGVKAIDKAGNVSDVSNNVTVVTTEVINDNERSPLGINLSGIADFSTEHQFINLLKQARFWGSIDAPWNHFDGTNGRPTAAEMVASNGYLKPGKTGSVIVLANDTWPTKGVDYVCLWEGDATVEIYAADKRIGEVSNSGRIVFTVPNDVVYGSLQLKVRSNSSTNPFKNAWLSELQFEENYKDQQNPDNIFNPVLISNWEAFKTIRFMDWMATNDSEVSDWRNTGNYEETAASGINDFAWAWKGVPVEVMVKLSNKMNVEPWFCLPHLATDEYITEFATIVNRDLKPNLKSYIEYSNECWNWQFQQTHYCLNEGANVWGENDNLRYAKYYAKQSINMFNKFYDVFTDKNKLVRVFSWQAAGNSTIFLDLEHGDWSGKAYTQADVIAIAPYFAGDLDGRGDYGTGSPALHMSVDEILDHCEEYIKNENTTWMTTYSKVATDRNLSLCGYEGGQHLVADRADLSLPNDSTAILLDKFTQANDHPRMKDLYIQYLNMWKDNGGELFCNFSSVGPHSKYGQWGAKVYENQSRADAPKYDALLTFMENNDIWFPRNNAEGSSMSKKNDEDNKTINSSVAKVNVYPNPAKDYLIVENITSDVFTVMLFDMIGNIVLQEEVNNGNVEICTSSFGKGIYFLSVKSSVSNEFVKVIIE